MLRLFGATRVSGLSGVGLPRQALLVAAVIDTTPGRATTRETIAQFLWPTVGAERAGANLRQMLNLLRHWEARTAAHIVRVSGASLERDENCLGSDVSGLLALGHARTSARLRLALELYAGDFLADFSLLEEPAKDWLDASRTSLRSLWVSLVIEGARAVGGELSIEATRRLENEAPYDDNVARAAMVSASLMGAQASRDAYERFTLRLREDLDGRPEQATVALMAELAASRPGRPSTALPRSIDPAPVSIASVPKVLVLPPAVASDSAGDRIALADLMVDEVTFALARARTFAVFAPHTARQLVRSAFPHGNPYGADYLVSTELRSVSGRSELDVRLVEIATHELLLAERIEVDEVSLPERHTHLGAAIGSRVSTGIERAERRYYRTTESASAYVAYLLGTDAIGTLELKSLRRAKAHFKQALKLSPSFVPARALLARTLCLEWLLLDRKEPEPIDDALRLARESVDIDIADPLGHREVGHALIYLDRLDEGLDALKSATVLGPHHADILLNYADGLIHVGENQRAREMMDRALSLNPLPPDQYHWISGTVDYMLSDYSAASLSFGRMKEREAAARFIAAVEAMNGNLSEARRQRDIYLRSHPDFRLADYMLPQRRAEDREHYLEGLRRAGFT